MDSTNSSKDACPFEFNFDPVTFKPGDTVSYRSPQIMGMPFVAVIRAAYDDYIELWTRVSRIRC